MIASLLCGVVLRLDGCTGCTLTTRNVQLCETHALEERTVFQQEARRLSSKDEFERCSALHALAALTHDHANAPSERVVQRIAALLDDESMTVRNCATALLGRPQHAQSALSALLDALNDSAREAERIAKDMQSLREKLGSKLTDDRRASVQADMKALRERGTALREWRQAMIDQLATFPDDRAVTAICAIDWEDKWVYCGEAWVRLGSRTAMKALIDSMLRWDVQVAAAERKLEEAKRGTVTAGIALAEAQFLEIKTRADKARSRIIAILAERGLVAPTEARELYPAWNRWYGENVRLFPEHLPGIKSPAW